VALFTYTFVNKVDRKGRVSVPASFRNELSRQSFNGVAVYPSIDGSKSLTGCEEDVLRQWSDNYRADDPFDTDSTEKRRKLFSAVQRLPLDPDGRVLLPSELLSHAGISTHAAFVGMGHEFQIWDPATYDADKDPEDGQSAAPEGDR
jgi:MraZ protein